MGVMPCGGVEIVWLEGTGVALLIHDLSPEQEDLRLYCECRWTRCGPRFNLTVCMLVTPD